MKWIHTTALIKSLFLSFVLVITTFGLTQAMPPHPLLLEKIKSGEIETPDFMLNLDELHKSGICVASNVNNKSSNQLRGDVNILVVLVEFSNNQSTVEPAFFDSLLFDSVGVTVRDYYKTISYGQVDIVTVNLPSSTGWVTAPQTYDYYVNGENGGRYASYPNNVPRLVEDIIVLIDPDVDFSNYDNNNDGFVDAFVVIHSGRGAEVTGDVNDIWSHKWNTKTVQATGDGVSVYEYIIQPEYIIDSGDMTIGILAHELGHIFGLPDLYDIDNSSYGIGFWGLMAYGSWGGTNGSLPTQPCAWSKIQIGFVEPINVEFNSYNKRINDVKATGEIYRLWTSGEDSDEYFLIENRQQTGYDTFLPGAGLLIWHIDNAKIDNTQEWYPGLDSNLHYRVALEQADGAFEIEQKYDAGDNKDVYPGELNATAFNAESSPSSDGYISGKSFVAIENIFSNNGIITADLKVNSAACCVGLRGNVNNDENNEIDLADIMYMVEYQFNIPAPPAPACIEEADVDGSGEINIADLVYLVNYQYSQPTGPAPVTCPID